MRRYAALAAGLIAGLGCIPAGTAGGYPTLTIPTLHLSAAITGDLATGLEFWPGVAGRPGHGPVAIAGHDVTPVPGFGPHGPFHRLGSLRKGDELVVSWAGRRRAYRVTEVVAPRRCRLWFPGRGSPCSFRPAVRREARSTACTPMPSRCPARIAESRLIGEGSPGTGLDAGRGCYGPGRAVRGK